MTDNLKIKTILQKNQKTPLSLDFFSSSITNSSNLKHSNINEFLPIPENLTKTEKKLKNLLPTSTLYTKTSYLKSKIDFTNSTNTEQYNINSTNDLILKNGNKISSNSEENLLNIAHFKRNSFRNNTNISFFDSDESSPKATPIHKSLHAKNYMKLTDKHKSFQKIDNISNVNIKQNVETKHLNQIPNFDSDLKKSQNLKNLSKIIINSSKSKNSVLNDSSLLRTPKDNFRNDATKSPKFDPKIIQRQFQQIFIESPKLKNLRKTQILNPMSEVSYHPFLEEPENLRIIKQHPRIRKSTNSKADRLMKEWLDETGKLTNDQEKILGSSDRMQKKTIYYFINKMEENQIPLRLLIDQKLLKKKKFHLAHWLISITTNKTMQNDILNTVYEMFNGIKEFHNKLENLKNTIKLMKFLMELAGKFSKAEISVYLLKFFAKMLTYYNECGNAINLYKTGFILAKTHNLHYLMMTLQKRMGKLNRRLNRNKVALKHFLRMLYMAWFLENEQFEFLAYDEIGLCFYYLNDIEKANFYHLRMLDGEKEPNDSIAKKLGLLKIKQLLANEIRSLDDLVKVSSDEEEELLFGEKKTSYLSKKDKQSQIEMKIFLKKESEKFHDDLQYKNQEKSNIFGDVRPAIPKLNKIEKPPKKYILGNREVYLMEKTMIFEKKPQLLSHLSRNRHLINFFEFNTKVDEEGLNPHREVFKTNQYEMSNKLDIKSLESLKKMVKKLKNNLEISILYLESSKIKKGQDQRRAGMLLRPMK